MELVWTMQKEVVSKVAIKESKASLEVLHLCPLSSPIEAEVIRQTAMTKISKCYTKLDALGYKRSYEERTICLSVAAICDC